MKTLESFEWTNFGSDRSKHDWDVLLDGQIRQLQAGVDFTSKPATMLTLCRNAAQKRGLRLRTSKVEDGIVIQAIKPEEVEQEAPKKGKKKSA